MLNFHCKKSETGTWLKVLDKQVENITDAKEINKVKIIGKYKSTQTINVERIEEINS